MSYIVVDVEADGPIPGRYNMVCFGAVLVETGLQRTFYGEVRPITGEWIPEALNVSGFNREQHEGFGEPSEVMGEFANWLADNSRDKPVFISDNLAFDWQWINYYFHMFHGKNPFGYSGRRIGDLYCGMFRNSGLNSEWKRKLRKTRHDHNPVNDAKGNAEALLSMQEMGLKIRLD